MSSNTEAARQFFDASCREDYDTMGRLIGDNYLVIDRARGITARAVEELQEVGKQAAALSIRSIEIDSILETTDGVVIVQTTERGTHTGTWRSVPPTGRPIQIEVCHILRFDDQHRIVSHDFYDDHLSILIQMGVVKDSDWRRRTSDPTAPNSPIGAR